MSPGHDQVFDISEATCLSCHHSAARNEGNDLVCLLNGLPAVARCGLFVYEPGSDESERHASE